MHFLLIFPKKLCYSSILLDSLIFFLECLFHSLLFWIFMNRFFYFPRTLFYQANYTNSMISSCHVLQMSHVSKSMFFVLFCLSFIYFLSYSLGVGFFVYSLFCGGWMFLLFAKLYLVRFCLVMYIVMFLSNIYICM